jgi:hypothetical protein
MTRRMIARCAIPFHQEVTGLALRSWTSPCKIISATLTYENVESQFLSLRLNSEPSVARMYRLLRVCNAVIFEPTVGPFSNSRLSGRCSN